jgi:asparagine synthase (glutamine-hydrolysing)
MSGAYRTRHHEIPYEPRDVQRIEQMAAHADEPFSDIGIEVASDLLAGKASQDVDYVLTGDGGDELFAGHPVYLADRMAGRFDKLPRFLQRQITRICQYLPDTEQKKSFMVKAKRFSYSVQFPAGLYANRWRLYYTDGELRSLLRSDWAGRAGDQGVWEDLDQIYDEADGRDDFSRTLYGDYYTVVDFYLRRMALARRFGLEGRFPLLDYRLAEYAAKIPPALKINAKGETKHVFHQAMAGFLPDEIVFRKDKLGHSIPLKNWMRDNSHVREFVGDTIATDRLKRRGLIDPKYVKRLWDDHMASKMNNSHRLWTLCVLELWLDEHVGRAS